MSETEQTVSPDLLDIAVEHNGDAWDVSLRVEGRHYTARAATILRGVTLVLYDARLICGAHYRAVMDGGCRP